MRLIDTGEILNRIDLLDGALIHKYSVMDAIFACSEYVCEVKERGHWIDTGTGHVDCATGDTFRGYKCSKCGESLEAREEDLPKYCFECGAKMDEEVSG